MKTNMILVAILAAAMAAPAAFAKNVDLVTLPKRDGVQLTIYNSEDITLVKETRSITVKKGANAIQFSWANTLIDPSSVQIRPLEHADDIEVADTVFPGQKPQHLIWNIESKFEGQVKVEVSYFTSGLSWSMDYVAIADPDETALQFRGYVRVFNNSGEEYEDAEVRLIVGTINLVEKIADLARRQGIPLEDVGKMEELKAANRREVAKEAFDRAEKDATFGGMGGGGVAQKKAKEVVKEGLSEYFMFSVEGTETIRNGWSKRMQAVKADGVKFDIVYRMRAFQYGRRPVRFFVMRNDDEHKMGQSPLPDGRVRLFRENGKDGLAYLGEETVRYVPIKAEIEVNLGPDDLLVYETRKMGTERMNFSFNPHNNRVNGWDEKTNWVDTIKNYRTKPITFELRRRWGGHVDYDSEVATTLFDYQTIEAKFEVPANTKKEYPATVVTHFGVNAKQQRIDLKK